MRLMGHIPIKRGNAESRMKVLERGDDILEHDGIIMMYPEGGVYRYPRKESAGADFEVHPFKFGMAYMAYKTNSPVIPVIIVGSDRFLPVHKWWKFQLRTPVRMHVGKAMYPAHYSGEDDFSDAVRKQMYVLYRENYPQGKVVI